MSAKLPSDLRAALAAEAPADRAALEAVWTALGTDADASAAEAPDADWNALRARLGDAPRRAPDRAPAGRVPAGRTRQRWIMIALGSAALVAAVVVGASVWRAGVIEHTAPVGETLAVALPDGSRVTLNSGATLRHARGFGHRDVTLSGEAFFDVAHDASAPFTVETPSARVEVLGTAFNVRAYGQETDVALVRGRVRVTAGASEQEILEPGEAVVVAEARISAPAPADVERAAAWQHGALAFADQPLSDVLDEISRRYGARFETEVPLGARVSAYYTARPAIEALLGDIGTAAGVRFVPGPVGYTVRPAR